MAATTEGRQIRPFPAILHDIGKGSLIATLSEDLADLVLDVVNTGKAGTLTLTVKVEPTKGSDRNTTVTATVTAKRPRSDQSAIFFNDQAGNLVRDDPQQQVLDLRTAKGVHLTGTRRTNDAEEHTG